jgi:hypothetical protein
MSTNIIPEDDNYASEEDSDFAIDDAPGVESCVSDDEDQAATHDHESTAKRLGPAADGAVAEDAGFENSGDEAIIKKAKKRKRKTLDGLAEDPDEGDDGGLVKTRSMRAAEYDPT